MKVYNQQQDKITELPSVISTEQGIKYLNKLSWEELNILGYYKINYETKPDRKYYTFTETRGIVNNIYSISYDSVDKPIEEVKSRMLKDLSEVYKEYKTRPRVDTGLGFDVDGGYDDIKNFEIGKKYALPEVKDADNNKHAVSIEDYDDILSAIELNGISLFNTKDTKEQEINALSTIDECILYEATPYEEEVDVVDEMTGEPTGETQVVTKYKNNIKEWFR